MQATRRNLIAFGRSLESASFSQCRAFGYFTWQDIPFGEASVSGQMRMTMTPITPNVRVTSATGRIY